MEFPEEIWNYIKGFTFDWERSHKQKFKKCLTLRFGVKVYNSSLEMYETWTHFPPWQNTNDIILDSWAENDRLRYAPCPNLPLTSICWNPNGTGGWWCGYGWSKINCNYIQYNKYNSNN
jgi:hypothetical protein|uniref:Uncharacterized protein n=1 Tax=viral metagenome TaxID=1070528 RepID=A0A6C0AL53_9ZZZZ